MKKTYITIIIPSYNSKGTIVRCLASVLNQSFRDYYKVIVVDSSDDGTNELIKKYFPQVQLIHLKQRTLPGKARNIGVRFSTSKYIAFTDADCIVDHYWIERIFTRIDRLEYDAVGGAIINGTPHSISGTLGYLNEFSFYSPYMKSGFVTATATANVCYRREVFRYQKFIDSSFAGEDTVFHWELINRGGKLYFDPEIKVTHLNRAGLIKVLMHQRRIGKGAGLARLIMKKDLIFISFPILCVLILPWARFLRMLIRTLISNPETIKRIFIYLPLSFIVSYYWAFGFYNSVKAFSKKR